MVTITELIVIVEEIIKILNALKKILDSTYIYGYYMEDNTQTKKVQYSRALKSSRHQYGVKRPLKAWLS